MALVLSTTLKLDGKNKDGGFEPKVFEEGTPFAKLSKEAKALAKELGLLEQIPDPEPTLEEEIESEESDEADSSEDSSEDSEGAEGEG